MAYWLHYEKALTRNAGTEEEPVLQEYFQHQAIYATDTDLEAQMSIAKAHACNGEITVEEIPDPHHEPTPEERITALEGQMAMADETSIELFEAQIAQEEINTAQDDVLIELYEMMEGA